jgi:protoporphyrinogen oxidase
MYFDIIIIGSGISGLYIAYNIKKMSPKTNFIILEKSKKEFIGGRTNDDIFYDSTIVTGAGVGRKDNDQLLVNLLNELGIKYKERLHKISYSQKIKEPVNIKDIINILKKEYINNIPVKSISFKDFFIKTLGIQLYNKFTISTGYTDYENADVYDTLYDYGMNYNVEGWTAISIPWKKLIKTLCIKIGTKHIKTSSCVIKLSRIQKNPCLFEIKIDNGVIYHSNKVIIATNIVGIQQLLPNNSLFYKQIHGQPFLRLYAKFSILSSLRIIIKEYSF